MAREYETARIAYHEAGHALVAVHEGFSSNGIVVRLNLSGEALTSARLPGASTLLFASSRLRVLLAGAVAQCITQDPDNERCLCESFGKNGNANGDWQKAEELARLLAHEALIGQASDDLIIKGGVRSDRKEAYC